MGPATPFIAIAATVISTAVSAAGAIQQGQQAKAEANYRAAVMRNNEILAKRAAADARLRGEADADKVRIAKRQLEGRQRAMLAANGQVVDQGSALDITGDTNEFGKLDELTTLSNAEREALSYEAAGMNYNAQAGAAQFSRGDGGYGAAAGTLLTGGGSVASKWYEWDKASATTGASVPVYGYGGAPGLTTGGF